MALDTVLKIGNVFRNAPNNLEYFRYVEPCPPDTKKENVFRLCLPVNGDYTFDFDNLTPMIGDILTPFYYLKYKTSNADGLVKYAFGDIFYSRKEAKEGGYYRTEDANGKGMYRLSSFNRGKTDTQSILTTLGKSNSILQTFRQSFENEIDKIETILKYHSALQYYFELQGNSHQLPTISHFLQDKALIIKYAAQKTFQQEQKKLETILGQGNGGLQWEDIQSNPIHLTKLADWGAGSVFLHFQFPDNQHWYDFKQEFDAILTQMFGAFFVPASHSKDLFVPQATLYKTLCSGNDKNDKQFPAFDDSQKYKSQCFTQDEIKDLFYAIDYTSHGILTIKSTDIKVIVLPSGENLLTPLEYLAFQKSAKPIEREENIDSDNQPDSSFLSLEPTETAITQFDISFCKKGGLTAPDVDLVELSGVRKSMLSEVFKRIRAIKSELTEKWTKTFKKPRYFQIAASFEQILGSFHKSAKVDGKYQSHMLKVLPQIYSANYYEDNLLLPAFIAKVEYSIRNDAQSRFPFLKFDLEFLFSIQNTLPENANYMAIIDSPSYKIGVLLGKLAQQFAGENSPIKSFEKNYVGNLTRRIGSIDDFVRLKTDIEQKLIMHDRTKYTHSTSNDLAEQVKSFDKTYNKHEAAFGFFESYFAPFPSKKEDSSTDNLTETPIQP